MDSVFPFIKKYWYLLLPFLVLAIITSIKEARTEDLHGDPYIFWAVGKKFLLGESLYDIIPGTQEYLYPPVAALLFQLLALMPFPIAVGIFTFFNFTTWLLLIILTYRILEIYFPNDKLRISLTFGIIMTIRYFWHNIIWVNVNELVALMSVAGVYFYLKDKVNLGLALLTLAMWTKVMPLLIIIVLFIRRPIHTFVTVFGFSVVLLVIIMGFREVDRGVQDYLDFWNIAFKPFLLGGKVYTLWIAFGISATFSKLLIAHPDLNGIHYNIAELSPKLVGKLSLIVRLIIFGATYFFVFKTRKQLQIPLLSIVLIYLTILLVAGVSWEGHHVTLLLPIAGLCQILTLENKLKLRNSLIVSGIVVGFATSDIVGTTLSDYLQAFSLITYFVLFMYGISIWLSYSYLKRFNLLITLRKN